MPTQYNNTHKITTHTRQLQQYTWSTNNNYTKDNLKLATKHTRQIKKSWCSQSIDHHISQGLLRIYGSRKSVNVFTRGHKHVLLHVCYLLHSRMIEYVLQREY